jgi:dissimilatory sulfite reductase (desulfoviridin) alpha/beta subunit
MGKNRIIPVGTKEKAALMVRSIEPCSAEFIPKHIRVVDESDKKYGPGQVQVTARQIITIPDFDNSSFPGIITLLINSRHVAGCSGNTPENAMASSRWFLYDVVPDQ